MAGLRDGFNTYTFTDISSGFFNKAKEKFGTENMVFKTLDVEKDIIEQGYEEGKYDIVVAANVIHATKGTSHFTISSPT